MRMRKKRNLDARIGGCGEVLLGWLLDYDRTKHDNNITEMLDFSRIFGNDNPVMLEIGCGKGGFVNDIAKQNPDINYIAVEKSANVIVTAMEQTLAENVPNIRYIIGLAEYLSDVIAPKSVAGLYLNFSCPYPKTTYVNRRLTHKRFLGIYKTILCENSLIRQKTDNRDFFLYSLDSFSQNGFEIITTTHDLHNSQVKGNIKTEYERIFSEKGLPIYYLEAKQR